MLVLFLHLRGVVMDHCLVHSDNGVQHGEKVAMYGSDELSAGLHMLLFLLV